MAICCHPAASGPHLVFSGRGEVWRERVASLLTHTGTQEVLPGYHVAESRVKEKLFFLLATLLTDVCTFTNPAFLNGRGRCPVI